MVATALLSLVLASAFGVVIVMQNEAAQTGDRFTAEGEAQTMASRVSKDLRTAVAPTSTSAAFASADANDVVFYASLSDLSAAGNGPVRLHAYISQVGTTGVYVFHEDATPPNSGGSPGNYTYNLANTVNRLDGQYLDATQPIFTYWRADGTQFTTMPITATADLRSIEAVGIKLRVRVHPQSPPVTIETRIHVRNVDYNPNT